MDQNLIKWVNKVLSITHENLKIENCEQIDTYKYLDETKGWVPDGYTLFIKVKFDKGICWNTTEVERTLYEHLGVRSVITV